MSELVKCPKCGKKYKLTLRNAGRRGRCPCGGVVAFPALSDPTEALASKAVQLAPVVADKGKAAASAAIGAAREYAPVVAQGVRRWGPRVLYWGVWQPLRLLWWLLSWPFRAWWRRRQRRRQEEDAYWAGWEDVRQMSRRWPVILRMSFHPGRPPTLSQFAYCLALGVCPVRASKQSMMLTLSAEKRRAEAQGRRPPLLGNMSDADLARVYEYLRGTA